MHDTSKYNPISFVSFQYTAAADTYFENVLSNLKRSSIDSLRYLRYEVDKNE